MTDEPTPDKKFYSDPMDIPWFRKAVEESERIMRETPEQSRPEGFKEIMSKNYVWTGRARMVSKRRAEGYSLFNYEGYEPPTQFTVLAPTREDATHAINDLLGTTEIAEWECTFDSVREIYQEAQVIHHE